MNDMAELVSVDRAGRIVIPKAIRDAAGIDERTQLLVAVGEHGRLVLQKVDVDALAGRLEPAGDGFAPEGAVVIQLGETEVFVRKGLEPKERVLRRQLSVAHGQQQRLDLARVHVYSRLSLDRCARQAASACRGTMALGRSEQWLNP